MPSKILNKINMYTDQDEVEGLSEDLEMSLPTKVVPCYELKEKVLPKKTPKDVTELMFQQALIRNKEREKMMKDKKQIFEEIEETVDRLKDIEV
jgi:hypothetical protein